MILALGALLLGLLLPACPCPALEFVALDPTAPPPYITMDTLAHEVAAGRALLDAHIARIDQALAVLAKSTDNMPREMDARVAQLHALLTETVQRLELQTRIAQQSVADALVGAEKVRAEQQRLTTLALDKAERTAADERQDLAEAIQRGQSALRDQWQNLRERLDHLEGERRGVSGAWALLLALVGVAGTVFGLLRARRPAPPA
jgi:chromosome segregation ATPase